jgi:hypothetical protein
VSDVPLGLDFDDGKDSGRQQLLALRQLRRDLERRAAQRRHARRPMALKELERELRELIAALDRRVPRVEQAGEKTIAGDAALLREKAVRRLEEINREGPAAGRG